MAISPPNIEIFSQKEMVILKPQGIWEAKTAREAESYCDHLLERSFPHTLVFDLSALKEFDTSGIWLIQRTIHDFKEKGHTVEVKHASEAFATLASRLETYKPSKEKLQKQPSYLGKRVVELGRITVDLLILTRDLIVFLGQVMTGLVFALRHPHRLRFTSIVAHMERFGVNALPIIAVMSVALGLVLAYQGEEQLRRFGAEIYTINLVSISMLREVGILITSILVAGRTGSSITAQIGIMKINQEVDALNTLGLSPMEVLVIPRFLALVLVMPLLAFVSDIAGLVGGGIMVFFSLDVTPQLYIHRLGEAVTLGGFWVGILKAPLFGGIIAIVSCFEGFRVEGTAESVGVCTTRSVVEGIFLVTLADALLSVFFSKVGI